MTDSDFAALQGAATTDRTDHDFDDRDVRALTRSLSVLPETGRARGADDLFLVVSDSGKEYLVDTRLDACECPDHQYRDVRCLHLRRVAFATGERALPSWVDRDAVDDQLGLHVADSGPCVAAADGGEIIVAGDGGKILNEDPNADDTDDGRPDDCDCEAFHTDTDLPCWPCYREGFDEPAPQEGEGVEDA